MSSHEKRLNVIQLNLQSRDRAKCVGTYAMNFLISTEWSGGSEGNENQNC